MEFKTKFFSTVSLVVCFMYFNVLLSQDLVFENNTKSLTNNLTNNPEIQQLKNQNKLLNAKIDSLFLEMKLQNESLKLNKENSERTLDFANTIIAWSSFILAVFGALALIGAYFGFRNLRKAVKLRQSLQSEISELQSKGPLVVKTIIWLREADDAYSIGDFQTAIDFYQKALNNAQNYIEAYRNLSWSYFALEDYEQALEIIQKARKWTQNKEEEYLLEIANIAFCAWLKNREESERAFRNAIKIDPNSPLAFRMCGMAYIILEDLKSAENSLKSAIIEKNDKEMITHFLLACLLYHNGNKEKSKELFHGTIDIATKRLSKGRDDLITCLHLGLSFMAINEKQKCRCILKSSTGKKYGFEMIEYFLHALTLLKDTDDPPNDINYALQLIRDLRYNVRNLNTKKEILGLLS